MPQNNGTGGLVSSIRIRNPVCCIHDRAIRRTCGTSGLITNEARHQSGNHEKHEMTRKSTVKKLNQRHEIPYWSAKEFIRIECELRCWHFFAFMSFRTINV